LFSPSPIAGICRLTGVETARHMLSVSFSWRSPDGARSPQRPRSYSRWPHRGARCDGGGPGPDELTQATLLTQTRAPSGERLPILHLLGIDLIRLIYKFQGREFRLTDMHGRVVQAILA